MRFSSVKHLSKIFYNLSIKKPSGEFKTGKKAEINIISLTTTPKTWWAATAAAANCRPALYRRDVLVMDAGVVMRRPSTSQGGSFSPAPVSMEPEVQPEVISLSAAEQARK